MPEPARDAERFTGGIGEEGGGKELLSLLKSGLNGEGGAAAPGPGKALRNDRRFRDLIGGVTWTAFTSSNASHDLLDIVPLLLRGHEKDGFDPFKLV